MSITDAKASTPQGFHLSHGERLPVPAREFMSETQRGQGRRFSGPLFPYSSVPSLWSGSERQAKYSVFGGRYLSTSANSSSSP